MISLFDFFFLIFELMLDKRNPTNYLIITEINLETFFLISKIIYNLIIV